MVKGLLETTDLTKVRSFRAGTGSLAARAQLFANTQLWEDRPHTECQDTGTEPGGGPAKQCAGLPSTNPRGLPYPVSPPNILKRRSRNTRKVGPENCPQTTMANPRWPDRHLCNARLSQPQAPLQFLIQKCLLFA